MESRSGSSGATPDRRAVLLAMPGVFFLVPSRRERSAQGKVYPPPDDGCDCGYRCYWNGGAAQDSQCTAQGSSGNYVDADCGRKSLGGGGSNGGSWAYQDHDCTATASDSDCGRPTNLGSVNFDHGCTLGGSDEDCNKPGGMSVSVDNDCGAGSTTEDRDDTDCAPCGLLDFVHTPEAMLPPLPAL